MTVRAELSVVDSSAIVWSGQLQRKMQVLVCRCLLFGNTAASLLLDDAGKGATGLL